MSQLWTPKGKKALASSSSLPTLKVPQSSVSVVTTIGDQTLKPVWKPAGPSLMRTKDDRLFELMHAKEASYREVLQQSVFQHYAHAEHNRVLKEIVCEKADAARKADERTLELQAECEYLKRKHSADLERIKKQHELELENTKRTYAIQEQLLNSRHEFEIRRLTNERDWAATQCAQLEQLMGSVQSELLQKENTNRSRYETVVQDGIAKRQDMLRTEERLVSVQEELREKTTELDYVKETYKMEMQVNNGLRLANNKLDSDNKELSTELKLLREEYNALERRSAVAVASETQRLVKEFVSRGEQWEALLASEQDKGNQILLGLENMDGRVHTSIEAMTETVGQIDTKFQNLTEEQASREKDTKSVLNQMDSNIKQSLHEIKTSRTTSQACISEMQKSLEIRGEQAKDTLLSKVNEVNRNFQDSINDIQNTLQRNQQSMSQMLGHQATRATEEQQHLLKQVSVLQKEFHESITKVTTSIYDQSTHEADILDKVAGLHTSFQTSISEIKKMMHEDIQSSITDISTSLRQDETLLKDIQAQLQKVDDDVQKEGGQSRNREEEILKRILEIKTPQPTPTVEDLPKIIPRLFQPDMKVGEAARATLNRVGSQYVAPGCRTEHDKAIWASDFQAAGSCQQCGHAVGDRFCGLQCSNRGHWVCWCCLVKDVNWEAMRFDQKILDEINQNLVIPLRGRA
eukprot:TRINITY_DN10958_c0_g1_i1.p1 TRINITY_DN10958_c0_g1~~TRINITY_DN10958_c0_g1_i1.p1  ORF type:complete len:692 (+),score=131.57 TRINITY_DN10958_c0_g1_i1:29-2104(+)